MVTNLPTLLKSPPDLRAAPFGGKPFFKNLLFLDNLPKCDFSMKNSTTCALFMNPLAQWAPNGVPEA